MKQLRSLSVLVVATAIFLAPALVHADANQLSTERLDALDEQGYFTPSFKAAVHDLVDLNDAIAKAGEETRQLKLKLPELRRRAADAEAKIADLRVELAKYDHPDETDFVALENKMNDPAAKVTEQIPLAQAYVWAYPTSPHQTAALQFLQQAQKKLADQQQAEKDAELAREAAQAELIKRAQTKQLSLAEWRDFLRDKSQDDLLKYLGRPDLRSVDFWVYAGDWTADPVTNEKVGMEVYFNAGRVTSVAEIHH